MAFRDLPEHARARHWRETSGLSRAQLSKLTGYSPRAIELLESGVSNNGKPIDANTLNRYRLVCAAVMAGLKFDWRKVTFGDQVIKAEEWIGKG